MNVLTYRSLPRFQGPHVEISKELWFFAKVKSTLCAVLYTCVYQVHANVEGCEQYTIVSRPSFLCQEHILGTVYISLPVQDWFINV